MRSHFDLMLFKIKLVLCNIVGLVQVLFISILNSPISRVSWKGIKKQRHDLLLTCLHGMIPRQDTLLTTPKWTPSKWGSTQYNSPEYLKAGQREMGIASFTKPL